ncbi:MAG: cohesin domain-containing protein [Candidatus Poribacteria bacterium]|nr:cohesin domain-containing protein [Candidatus Poribacteria bacterium]
MMKFSRYFSFVCILAIACIFTVGCEKMEKPVMDAVDMAMTDTETPAETPAEMDGPQQPPEEDTQQPETPPEMDGPQQPPEPPEMDDTETPAEMDVDATLSISPTEIALPEVGEQLTINVNIDSKEQVRFYQLTLTFDATVLKFVEHSITNYIPDIEDYTLEDSMLDDGKVVLSTLSFTSTGIGEGMLASVTFEVIEKKASTIVLSVDNVNRPDRSRLDVVISEDTVVIQ